MKTKKAREQDRYFELIKTFPLKRIVSEDQHREAVAQLLTLEGNVETSEGERQYADALSVLIRDYETSHHAIELEEGSPLDILKHLMAEQEMNVSRLGEIIGSQPNASLVLAGKRELSKAHIRNLADYFKVDAGIFL